MALRKSKLTKSKIASKGDIDYEALYKEAGGDIEEVKRQPTLLQRIFNFLDAFSTANAVSKAIETGDIGEGLKTYGSDIVSGIKTTGTENKKTYSDVMGQLGWNPEDKAGKIGKGIAGFVGDVVLDPTTWLTMGTGGVARAGVKGGVKAIAKEGIEKGAKEIAEAGAEKLAKEGTEKLATKVGKEATEEGLLKRVLTGLGGKGAKTLDITAPFTSKTLLSLGEVKNPILKTVLNAYTNPLGATLGGAKELPVVGKTLQTAQDELGKLFKPRYQLEKAGLGGFGQKTYQLQDMLRGLSMSADVTMKDLERQLAQVKNPELIPYLVENTPTSLMEELASKGTITTDALAEYKKLMGETIPQVAKETVVPEIEGLAQEARKYKSAEEFIKAKTGKDYVTVYHRTNTPIEEFGTTPIYSKENKGEFFVSNRPNEQITGYGDNVLELRVKKKDLEINDEFPSGEKHYTIPTSIADEAIQLKSQLTNLWNKVNQQVQPTLPEPLQKILDIQKGIQAEGGKALEATTGKAPLENYIGRQVIQGEEAVKSVGAKWSGYNPQKAFGGAQKERVFKYKAEGELGKLENPLLGKELTKEELYRNPEVKKLMDIIKGAKADPRYRELVDGYKLMIQDAYISGQSVENMAIDMGREAEEFVNKYKTVKGKIDEVAKKRNDLIDELLAKGREKYISTTPIKYSTTGLQGKEAAKEVARQIALDDLRGKKAMALQDFIANNVINGKTDDGLAIALDTAEKGYREVQGIPMLKGKYVAEPVADVLEKTHKAFFSDEGTQGFVKAFDAVSNLWKASVTKFFPAFHVRNAMGNVYLNWLADVNVVRYKDALDVQKYAKQLLSGKVSEELANKKLGAFTVKEVYDNAINNGLFGSGQFGELATSTVERNPILNKVLGGAKKIDDFAGAVGEGVESNAKLAHFIDKLNKGYGKGLENVTGDLIRDSALSVKKYLFDYSDLTDFEKNVMKRLIPFYTFMRKNAELEFSEMVRQPNKYRRLFKALASIKSTSMDLSGVSEEDMQNAPDWLQDSLGIVLGKTPEGDIRMLSGFGLPIESINSLAGTTQPTLAGNLSETARVLANSLNPLIKTPIERATGYNIFKDKPIAEDTSGYEYRNMPKVLQDLLGVVQTQRTNAAGEEYLDVKMPAETKYWLNAIAGRGLSTAGRVTNVGEDPSNILSLLSGVKVYQQDPDWWREQKSKEEEEKMIQWLIENGLLKKYQNYYVPKENR